MNCFRQQRFYDLVVAVVDLFEEVGISLKVIFRFGLRVGKKKKVEKFALLLLLVNWLHRKWLSSCLKEEEQDAT